jgi:hypothetical protein
MAIISLSDVDSLAEHNFRSLEEVERYVDGLTLKIKEDLSLLNKYEVQFARTEETAATEFKINVTKTGKARKTRAGKHILVEKFKKVVIPNVNQLQKNFSIVDELFDDLDKLKTVENIVSVSFRGKPGAGKMIEGIKTRRKITESGIKKAQDFLAKIGQKYAPTPFKEFVQEVADLLAAQLEFEDSENFIYVTPEDTHKFKFTHYLRLIGLEDDEGKSFPELYVVFSCILSPAGKKQVTAEYFVNILYEFQTPGKFDIGTTVDSAKGAVLVLGGQLDSENFANALGTLPMNLEEKKLKKNQFSVKNKIFSLEVDEKSLTFNLVKGVSDPEVSKIVEHLYADVKGLLYKIRAKLKVRVTKELGRTKIIFTLANLARDGEVSVDDLKWIQEMTGIDDDKLRKIARTINGG